MVIRTRLDVAPDILRKDNGKVTVEKLTDEAKADFMTASRLASVPIIKFIRNGINSLPRPSVHKFRWSHNKQANDRARRWWFSRGINTKPTNGIRYIRQGLLAQAFDVLFKETRKGTPTGTVSISGKTDSRFRVESGQYQRQFKYKFVVGSFNQREGARWQLVGHKRTGWWRINDIATLWFDRYVELVRKEYANIRAKRKNN